MYIPNILRRWTLLPCAVAALGLTACSEDDGTVEEYPDWQATNEAYFNHLSDSVARLISAGNTEWKLIKCFSKDSSEGTTADYIIAHVESCGHAEGTASPLLTDSVAMHYRGWLLPSTSYNSGGLGLQFDSSYSGRFDASTAVASTLYVGAMIDGFATALQHMHDGDRWTVYIPYQLAYGTSGSSTIPGYSTLVFNMRLAKHWRAKAAE